MFRRRREDRLTTEQWKIRLLSECTTQRERDDVLAMFERYELERDAA